MSSVKGNNRILYLSPFSNNLIHPLTITNTELDSRNDTYLDDFILIYINDEEIPFAIKRHYLINLTYSDIDYSCDKTITDINVNVDEEYCNLYKLFLNYPQFRNIVVSKTDLHEIILDEDVKRIQLVTKEEEKLTYPKIKYDLKQFDTKNLEIMNEISDSIEFYAGSGYSYINGYLIRLNFYREKKQIPLCAKTILDIVNDRNLRYFCYCWYNTIYSDKCKFTPIEGMENIVKYMDLAFYKLAPRTIRENEFLLSRGTNDYYPFLNEIGDKMIIENYISTTEHTESQFGRYEYKIVLSEGIPYIKLENFGEIVNNHLGGDIDFGIFFYTVEKEVLLPRNLLAELIKIDEFENDETKIKYQLHTIKLSCIYPNQFDLDEPICITSNLYNVSRFDKKLDVDTLGGKNKTRKNKRKIKKIFCVIKIRHEILRKEYNNYIHFILLPRCL